MITRDNFIELTNNKASHPYLYSIMPIHNIPSVMEHGILSHDLAKKIAHESVALEDVQNKREVKIINTGRKLHSYANLYFDSYNPMLSRLRHLNNEICLLAIDPSIMNVPGTVVTSCNAASGIVQFVDPIEMTDVLDFDIIYKRYWVDENGHVNANNKLIKCAEVLVPDYIPYNYIAGAIVISRAVKAKLEEVGFNRNIRIDNSRFF